MTDYKMQLIDNIRIIVNECESDPSSIIDKIVLTLNDYDVTKRNTEVVIYDDTNDRLLKRYCACLRVDGKSENTIYQYYRTLIKMGKFLGKHYTEIGKYDIRLFLAFEKQRGVSNVTLENTRSHISAFYQWMTREELIDRNPCQTISPIKTNNDIKYPFSSVEIDTLRQACKNLKERALIEILISSGIRVNELSSMNVTDINFEDMSIHVKYGKGNKERITYFNEVAKTHIQRYIISRTDHNIALFCNKQNDRIQTGGIRFLLKELGKRAGVDNVHPHRFRRTFASTLAARGMALQDIRRLMGHSDINTTLRYIYTNDNVVHGSYNRYIA